MEYSREVSRTSSSMSTTQERRSINDSRLRQSSETFRWRCQTHIMWLYSHAAESSSAMNTHLSMPKTLWSSIQSCWRILDHRVTTVNRPYSKTTGRRLKVTSKIVVTWLGTKRSTRTSSWSSALVRLPESPSTRKWSKIWPIILSTKSTRPNFTSNFLQSSVPSVRTTPTLKLSSATPAILLISTIRGQNSYLHLTKPSQKSSGRHAFRKPGIMMLMSLTERGYTDNCTTWQIS